MKPFSKLLMSLVLFVLATSSAWAAGVAGNLQVDQTGNVYTFTVTVFPTQGNVKNPDVTADIDIALGGVGNYTIISAPTFTGTAPVAMSINSGFDGSVAGDDLLASGPWLYGGEVAVIVFEATVTNASLVDSSLFDGLISASNPRVPVPLVAVFVTITTFSDISVSNENSYDIGGACSEVGVAVDYVITDGVTNVTGTTVCTAGNTWAVSGLNVSGLNDGSITITANHSSVQAQVVVNKDTAPIPIITDISVTKSDGSASYTPGGQSNYVITINNTGQDVAGVLINDQLSTTGGSISWSCSASAGSACASSSGVGDITNESVDILDGGVITFNVVVTWSLDPTAY